MQRYTGNVTVFTIAFVAFFGMPFSVHAAVSQEDFIMDIEAAFSERQELINQYPVEDTMSDEEIKDAYDKWVQPEYEMIQEYKDVEFDNAKFDQLAHMYINGVNDQKMSVQYLPNYPTLFNAVWAAGYNQRTMSIVPFVDYYGMQLDNDIYLEFVGVNNNIGQPQYTVTIGDADNTSSVTSNETEGSPIGCINDLFADKAIAEFVREKTGKIDVSQEVTQGELNEITDMKIFSADDYGPVENLEGISHLQNLEYLGLYNTCAPNLATLPEELFSLQKLKELDVHSSSITELPAEIGNLQNLETLSVGWTGISELPNQIGNLTNLRSLVISYTAVSDIPESIGELTNLETLEMPKTEVSVLPDSIGNCKALKKLNISDTKITNLPESLYNLKLDSL